VLKDCLPVGNTVVLGVVIAKRGGCNLGIKFLGVMLIEAGWSYIGAGRAGYT
jgi:hypothetical protein